MIIDHKVGILAVAEEAVQIDLMIDHHFAVIVHNLVTEMIGDSEVEVEAVEAIKVEDMVDKETMDSAATDRAAVAEVVEILVVMGEIEQIMAEVATEVVMGALVETEVVDLAADLVVGLVEEVLRVALTHANLKVHPEPNQKTLKSSLIISK